MRDMKDGMKDHAHAEALIPPIDGRIQDSGIPSRFLPIRRRSRLRLLVLGLYDWYGMNRASLQRQFLSQLIRRMIRLRLIKTAGVFVGANRRAGACPETFCVAEASIVVVLTALIVETVVGSAFLSGFSG
uniref:Uncharacterized protein n=1 Tax=Brassica oleracea var. oleracea TaxID=109376 RepID=A0A0D3DK91_BRAOL